MDKRKLKAWELALLGAVCLALCTGAWAQGRQDGISSRLVRLHVVAVSDDALEQEIKLSVRDGVLEYLSPALEAARGSDEAQRIISSRLPEIRAAAQRYAQGREVRVSLEPEYFPTRRYDGFTLPAGRYDCLRVTLGSGQGHNWWCVVFPPLCIDAAARERALDSMAQDDRALITEAEGYELRFRIVELWGEIMQRLASHSA